MAIDAHVFRCYTDQLEAGLLKRELNKVICKLFNLSLPLLLQLRACLHGGEGPQVGEVTRLGGVTRLSI